MVLQHGTLPLYGDLLRIIAALSFEDDGARADAAAALRASALTLEEAVERRVTYEDAAAALAAGFATALNLQLEPDVLKCRRNRAGARVIRAEKYAHDSWTRRDRSG
jgi:lipoyl(octanoyl) transferase